MPFDMIGWSEAAPGTGTVGVLAGLGEKYFTTTGDSIKIKARSPYLLGLLYAAESTPGRAELAQPSLLSRHQFTKAVDLNTLCTLNGISHHRGRPLPLMPEEYCTAYSVNATDEDTLIGAILGSGKITSDMIEAVNPTHKIRGYATQTLTANTWTGITMTWDQSLPKGKYAIVGMLFGSYLVTTWMSVIARIILPESPWRPGVFGVGTTGSMVTNVNDVDDGDGFNRWPLMPEIFLEHDNMPTFEALSPGASTTHIVNLELVKVR